jgi:hypothetical protein
MATERITIPTAHGDAIHDRMQQIKHTQSMITITLPMTVQVLIGEDKRHTDAIVKSFGLDPEKYVNYELVKDADNNWALNLHTVDEKPAPGPVAVPEIPSLDDPFASVEAA